MKIRLAEAVPGMILSQDIVSKNVRILKKGSELNDKVIQALHRRDIQMVDIIDEETVQQISQDLSQKISRRFQGYEDNKVMMQLQDVVIKAAGEAYG